MPDILAFPLVLRLAPRWVAGSVLHRRGLSALAAGRLDAADRLLEVAALAYREELAVTALARLRVHQRMLRLRRQGGDPGDSPDLIEVVQAVQRLDRLERFESPHALDDARTVLAEWLGDGPAARAA